MQESPLGTPHDSPDTYAPDLLHPIPRAAARASLNLGGELPFNGGDIWNAWELTWLAASGRPEVACCELYVPATSRCLIESKSLKLYLNSFAMTPFASIDAVAATLRADIGDAVEAPVTLILRRPGDLPVPVIDRLPGVCIDGMDIPCDTWEVDARLLAAEPAAPVEESLHSHLLRSLCPVTAQPDYGSVLVSYRGPRIQPSTLLRYLVSFRRHQDFHEACVERMFLDIRERCRPEQLTVCARYQRRGGIDINPWRSTEPGPLPNWRLWRQ